MTTDLWSKRFEIIVLCLFRRHNYGEVVLFFKSNILSTTLDIDNGRLYQKFKFQLVSDTHQDKLRMVFRVNGRSLKTSTCPVAEFEPMTSEFRHSPN